MPIFSIKAEGKPSLEAWDAEKDYADIKRWVYDNRNYSRRNLQLEEDTLRRIYDELRQAVISRSITPEAVAFLIKALSEGAGGVWETASSKLEQMAYHFPEVRSGLKELLFTGKSTEVVRGIITLDNAFPEEELVDIFTFLLSHRSKAVRGTALGKVRSMQLLSLKPILQARLPVETDAEIKKEIQHILQYCTKKWK